MSILDGMFSKESITCAELLLKPLAEAIEAEFPLTLQQKRALDAAQKGVPLGAVLGIDRKQRDAMFRRGCDLVALGQIERGRDLLTFLLALQPLDARVHYVLALACQALGEIEIAAKTLINFIALDATNPDGHLRLGECLLAAKEYEQARACFRTAERLCAQGHGGKHSREQAARMNRHLQEHLRSSSH